MLEQKVRERTEELRQINKSLEVSNHDLQQFASVASHDLKEPLRKIQLFGAILKDKFLHEDPNAMSYMERIVGSSERMARLINDLLNYSRLSVESIYEPTDFNLLIDETGFEGASAFLFGAVLARFFTQYVSLNSFTETQVTSATRGEIMRWAPGSGLCKTL